MVETNTKSVFREDIDEVNMWRVQGEMSGNFSVKRILVQRNVNFGVFVWGFLRNIRKINKEMNSWVMCKVIVDGLIFFVCL